MMMPQRSSNTHSQLQIADITDQVMGVFCSKERHRGLQLPKPKGSFSQSLSITQLLDTVAVEHQTIYWFSCCCKNADLF